MADSRVGDVLAQRNKDSPDAARLPVLHFWREGLHGGAVEGGGGVHLRAGAGLSGPERQAHRSCGGGLIERTGEV